MANTLTNLIPVLYTALDRISREMVGFIPSVSQDFSAERAAKDQTVRSPIVPAATTHDITPGTNPGDRGDMTIGHVDLTISKSKYSPVRWNGEEQLSLQEGTVYERIAQDRFTQAMRALVNEVEKDIGGLYKKTSRAYGTAGTAPFGSNLQDSAEVRKILDDNGAPNDGERTLVINTDAGVNLRKLAELSKANEAGSDDTLRRGTLLDLHGFAIRESAGVSSHTGGTATSVDTSGTHEVGHTEITVKDASPTSISIDLDEGDVVTIGNYDYVVTEKIEAAGELKIAEPGLMEDVAGDTDVEVANDYDANVAFHRSSMLLAARTPAMPIDGDAAFDVMDVADPVSGLTFQIAAYRQYRQVKYEVGLAWGMQGVKPEHAALLLG